MQISYWRMFLAGIAIEYAVCLVISFFWNNRDQYWYGLLIMFGLWAVQAALGLKNLVVTTIYFHLLVKSDKAKFLEEKMFEADMPDFGRSYAFCSDYLVDVLQDENATRQQVVLATEWTATMDTLKSQGAIRGLRMMKISDLAMESYFKKRAAWESRKARSNDPRFT